MACSTARQKVDGDIVRNIRFDAGCPAIGVCDTPNSLLQTAMEQKNSSAFVLVPPFSLLTTPEPWKSGALERDAYRLEIFFAHRGWFDARFEGWDVHEVRPRVLYKRSGRSFLGLIGARHGRGDVKRAGVLDIVGHIDPGPQAVVRQLSFLGYDKHVGTVVNSVKSQIGIREGEPYSLETTLLARDALQHRLRERGYAYADAQVHSQAYPDESAVDITMAIDMGSAKTVSFGPVEFIGVEDTPVDKLLNMVDFDLGDRYSLSRLDRTRKKLFNTSAFSVVDIVPDLSVRGAEEVPVTINVTETQFRTIRGGVGLEYDGFRLTPQLSSSFKHVNLFRRLVRVEAGGSVSYSSRASELTRFDTQNVLYSGRVGMTWPQLLARNVDLSGVISYDRDLQNSQFLYTNPEVDLGAVYRVTEYGSITFGPHWELYTMPQLLEGKGGTEQRVSGETLFGRGFDGRFQLTSLDARVNWDWRNDPIKTTAGSYWDLAIRQAVPLGKDDFLYTDISAEVRGYQRFTWPVIGRFTGVGRIKARALKSWNDSGLPYQERVFMGGLQDIRGYRDGFVGPYDVLCMYAPSQSGDAFSGLQRAGKDVTQRYLPRGGVAGATGTIESRMKLLPAYGLGWSVFGDAGLLALERQGAGLKTLTRWSVGGGLSYDSLVGPIRIDLALRPLAAQDQGPVDYVNCANADKQARPYGLFTTRDRSPEYPNDVRQPVIQLLFTLSQL